MTHVGNLRAVSGRVLLAALLATPMLASCARQSTAPRSSGPAQTLRIRRVIDGDTVVVFHPNAPDVTVRLLGIDTPETKRPNTPVQCFGPEATRFTKRLLPAGTGIRLVRDVEARDRYGRLLAYVYRADNGLFVNLELARHGYAMPYTYPPNVAHADALVAAAAAARDSGLGLWGSCPAR